MDNFVYVLGCIDASGARTYVGWTNDLALRLKRHNAGRGARSTRGRAWVLLYVEHFNSKNAAMSREWHLKKNRAFRKRLTGGIAAQSLP